MSTEDRRTPVWVPVATAVAGALVGFGLVTTLGADDTEAVRSADVASVALDQESPVPAGDETTATTDASAVATDETPTAAGDEDAATATDRTRAVDVDQAAPTAEPAPTATARPTSVPLPPPTPTTAPAPATAPTTPAPPPTGAAPASGTTVGREQAGAIAAAHVGGVVDSIGREDDYGAAWDVDVYAPDGEYTIYVSAAGAVVRVEGPFRD